MKGENKMNICKKCGYADSSWCISCTSVTLEEYIENHKIVFQNAMTSMPSRDTAKAEGFPSGTQARRSRQNPVAFL